MNTATTKGEKVFVAIQEDEDTFVMPTSSGTIFLTSEPDFKQKEIVAENQEESDDLGELPGKFCGFNMGDWKLAFNLKHSGISGTESVQHPFYQSVYGRYIKYGDRVEYLHYRMEDPIVFLSFVLQKDMVTEFVTGAYTNTLELKIQKGKIQGVDISGKFIKKVRAGKSFLKNAIDGTTTAVTTIPLKELEGYKRFDVDSLVIVGTDNNAGSGFKIIFVDPVTNSIEIETGVTTVQTEDAVVKGFCPVATNAGYNTTTQFVSLKLNTGSGLRSINITEGTFKVENNFKAKEDEMSDTGYAGGAVKDTRKVSLTFSRYYTLEDIADPFDIIKGTEITGELSIGKESGSILQFNFPNLRLTESNESGKPDKKAGKTLKAHPSGIGNDESKMIFK